jgi:pimeloyl-ACP methyl ester carboxylesterase
MRGKLERVEGKDGPATTVYHIEGGEKLFFFIPGNPGLAEYYVEYLDGIHSRTEGKYEFFCPSHIGFDTSPESVKGYMSQRVYNLDEQIEQKVDLLKQLTADKEREVVIMGHSVGAWMVQRVVVRALKEIPHAQIKLVGLLTPTIQDIALSDKGQLLVKAGQYLTSNPGSLVGRFSQALYWTMPTFALQNVFRLVMKFPPQNALDATLEMISRPNIIQQFIDMGAEEMDRIKDEPGEDISEFWDNNFGYKIWMFFVPKDHWIKEETKAELIEKYSNLDHVVIEETDDANIQHAFCVRNYDIMAEKTTSMVKDL